MTTATANHAQVGLDPGVTRAGAGLAEVVWNILGHTYYLKAESANAFAFETYDPPGTFVPPHVHPTQDEFICVLENEFDLYLDGQHHKAHAGDLVRMPAGIPHGYYNLSDAPTRALFWVAPGRRLRELFDVLHNMEDPAAVVRESAQREVHFLKPEDYAFDPLALKGAA
ncbi:MAG: cupin domain-containing protein [Acetobacteraceae bacterium]|nr:cupin domain-containing protein [Acetobacteraceae bacterium]